MVIKVGRRELNVGNDDVIFYNGACYMLTSQLVGHGFNKVYPTITKTQINKLLKENKIRLVSEKIAYQNDNGYVCWHKYYKFNVKERGE